ncbi:MAG: hypothetical protein JNL58_02600 [Planctomyces sp.]|nr:hypothetical protein [Planctomyces sp.]
MTTRASICVICLGGDKATCELIDTVLAELQVGLSAYQQRSLKPMIQCCYIHGDSGRDARCFEISEHQPSFRWHSETRASLSESVSPESNSTALRGDPGEQVRSFCEFLKGVLPSSGPVHFIVVGHGVPAIGVSSVLHPVAANHTLHDVARSQDHLLMYDDLGHSMSLVPRLNSLTLHMCYGSSIEAICSLSAAPVQFAFQGEMRTACLKDWLGAIAGPHFDPVEAAEAAFKAISDCPHQEPISRASAHYTNSDSLLSCLNRLGAELLCILDVAESGVELLARIRLRSAVACSVDVQRFCHLIAAETAFADECRAAAAELSAAVDDLQFAQLPWHHDELLGINLYFPQPGAEVRIVEQLPAKIQEQAPDWCLLLRKWQSY